MRFTPPWPKSSNAFIDMLTTSKSVLKHAALMLIRGYQLTVSPFLGPACRFYPSCSEYAYLAISRYGLFKGVYMATRRLLRCHPFHSGGIDPVP